ncbi:MAG: hypothetical protein ACE5GA_04055 [Candidatus Zixiibacteriota bacterium]
MKKAHRLLYEVVDDEASAIERAELDSYLKQDDALRGLFNVERLFRARLKEHSQSDTLPPALKERILASLARIDVEETGGEPVAPAQAPIRLTSERSASAGFSLRYLLPMAASVALFVFGSLATVQFFQHQRAYATIENHHYISRDMLADGVIPEITTDATKYISENFGVGLSDNVTGLSLCGGELVDLDKSRFAHFQFCGNSEDPVSIFVGSAEDFSLPETPTTIIAGKRYFRHSCHGCELMYWRSGGALIVAATSPDHMDDHQISELVRGINGISTPTETDESDN